MSRNLKLTTSMLIIATLIMSIGCIASAENTYRFDDARSTFMYATNDEFIWLINNDNVKVYDLYDTTNPIAKYVIVPADHIYATNDGLYVYREIDECHQIELYDQNGNSKATWQISNDVFFQQFIVADDKGFAVAFDHPPVDEAVDIGANSMLYSFSLTDNSGEFCLASHVMAVAVRDHSEVVCLYDDGGQYAIGVWSTSIDEITDTYPLTGMEFSAITSYENECYLLSDLGIHDLDYTTGTITLAHTMQQGEENWLGLQRAGQYIVTEDFMAGELRLFEIGESAESNTLVLVNLSKFNDARINAAVSMFQNKNPEVKVSFIDVDNAKLSTALMANEPGYDILLADDYRIEVYRESGVLEDLSGYSEIWEKLEAWNDMPYLIGESRDSVPLYILPVIYSVNEDMHSLIDENFPQQTSSWAEFYAAASDYYAESGLSPIGGSIRFPVFFDQYFAWCVKKGTVDFDTSIFKDGMLLYQEAYEDGLVVSSDENDCILNDTNLGIYPQETTVLLPLLDGEMIYPCSTYSLAISRTSREKDLAAEFLSCFVSVEAQRAADVNTMAAGFLKEATLYACSDTDTGYPSESQVVLNEQLLENTVRMPYNMDFNIYAGDQIELFLHGNITIDELAHNLNEKYNMTWMG